MKILKTGLLSLLLVLCAACASAQLIGPAKVITPRKPELFRDLPNRMEVHQQALLPLLQKNIGEKVSVLLASGFTFDGVVVSKSNVAETRYKTVVLKSTNRPGASFAITSIQKADGTLQYSGRMLSLKHNDAYEMKDEGGQLALEKMELSELVNE